jgi:hypothetical protein
VSIQAKGNTEEKWTLALRFLLEDLDYLYKWFLCARERSALVSDHNPNTSSGGLALK